MILINLMNKLILICGSKFFISFKNYSTSKKSSKIFIQDLFIKEKYKMIVFQSYLFE